MKYLLFIVLLAAVLVTAGCVSNNNRDFVPSTVITLTSPTLTSTPTHRYVADATPYITIDPYATPTRIVYPRLMTGMIITGNNMYGGEGELIIDNTKGDSDVVSILTYQNNKKPLIGVFIQKWTSFTINNINDGSYDLYILSGENWNLNTKQFNNNSGYMKFEDSFTFTTSNTEFTIWRVTLYPVIDGKAKTKPISQDDFPRL